MNIKLIAKQMWSQLLLSTGLYSSLLHRMTDHFRGVILMYHRIIDPSDVNFVEPGMYVTPKTFEMQLKIVKEFCSPVSLSYLLGAKEANSKPFCALTFDDGWSDFYCKAYPILVKYNVPATVFPVTSFVSNNQQFWTDKLAGYLLLVDAISSAEKKCSYIVQQLISLRGTLQNRMQKGVDLLKPHSSTEIQHVLNELGNLVKAHGENSIQGSFLNWGQIKEMRSSGLITFGSHTHTHAILTTINSKQVKEELHQSMKVLFDQNAMDHTNSYFCYPNGNSTVELANLVQESRYSAAVTTSSGWISKNSDRFRLPRMGVHQDVSATRALFLNRLLSYK